MENKLLTEALAALDEVKAERDKILKNKKVREIAAIIVGVLLLVGGAIAFYYHGKVKAQYEAELDKSFLLIQDFKNQKAEDMSTIGTIKQIAGSEHAAKVLAEKQVKELDGKLKNIKSVVKTVFVVDVDTFRAEITKHDTIEGEGIPYGSTFVHSDSLKYLSGTINETSVSIDSLSLAPSSITVTIASIKRGLFKKAEPSVIVDFSNPYFKPVSGQNVIVKDKLHKPKRLAWLLSGIAVGLTGGILLMAN